MRTEEKRFDPVLFLKVLLALIIWIGTVVTVLNVVEVTERTENTIADRN